MLKSLLNKDITPACEYCSRGRMAATGSEVLCRKKGIADPFDYCGKFKYDPLRRKPRKPPVLPEYNEADFAL
ncbi:MAG: hypothetical protein FWF08_09295 [Oscillospiraceae bacterium]|nr:hypothetical protein [Oscillospiraceae bacterium]